MPEDYNVDIAKLSTALLTGMEVQLRHFLDKENTLRSCINCNHFNEAKEICTMYGSARPPARVIAYGCSGHSKDLPF